VAEARLGPRGEKRLGVGGYRGAQNGYRTSSPAGRVKEVGGHVEGHPRTGRCRVVKERAVCDCHTARDAVGASNGAHLNSRSLGCYPTQPAISRKRKSGEGQGGLDGFTARVAIPDTCLGLEEPAEWYPEAKQQYRLEHCYCNV